MSQAEMQSAQASDVTAWIDQVERRIVELGGMIQATGEQLEGFPVTHRFTPGIYIRELKMPPTAIVVGRTHATEHPWVMTTGRILVFVEGDGWIELVAPASGITKIGTRRVAVVLEPTTWTTFHATTLTDIEEVENFIFAPHVNPLLGLQEGSL